MNFFRKLFGSKPAPKTAAPAAPQTVSPSASKPASAETLPETAQPSAPAASPASESPPRVSAESVGPAATESTPFSGTSASFFNNTPAQPKPVKIETTLLTLDGPVWLPATSPAIELFPAKPDDASAIAFIGGSAEMPQGGFKVIEGRAPFALDPGALSRAIPLYLADQVELGTDAITRTLQAWMVKPRSGFMIGGKQWDDATAARQARQAPADDPSDYVVLSHLVCTSSPWRIELRLVRTIDAACLTTLSADCDPHDPAAALPSLAAELLAALAKHAELPAHESGFATPAGSTEFLARLDHLLVLRISVLPGAAGHVRNEQALVEELDAFARAHADSLPTRLLFTHALASLAKIRPAMRADLALRAETLQRELPMSEPAQSVLARIRQESLAD